jgi:hypothetical protein
MSGGTGFVSNYSDSGYTLTVNTWYNQNNVIQSSVSSNDIYYATQQPGVYMINGGTSTASTVYPIFGSLSSMTNMGAPNNSDDAWIVYPGFGFVLYNDNNYTNQLSRFYTNTSNVPAFFSFSNGGFANQGKSIQNTSGTTIQSNHTNSVRIYFRGQEIGIDGLF